VRSERDAIVEPVFPEADPYPSIREPGVALVAHRAIAPTPVRPIPGIGEHTSVAIQKYVDDALASTHTRRPTPVPLPRTRVARGSEPPSFGVPVWSITDDGDSFADDFAADADDADTVEAPAPAL
jgi:hypothetical protein